jgi:hypothetical protein
MMNPQLVGEPRVSGTRSRPDYVNLFWVFNFEDEFITRQKLVASRCAHVTSTYIKVLGGMAIFDVNPFRSFRISNTRKHYGRSAYSVRAKLCLGEGDRFIER